MIKNLINIQNELKAPKSNYNKFGKFRYRSAEDILTAVKPILQKYDCQMTITDDVVAVGDRIYVRATVALIDTEGNAVFTSAMAREDESKKGMDGSQITGTASSYARKYALNGMFLIDDTKDADTDEYKIQQDVDELIPDRQFLEEHGSDRITKREIKRLTDACKEAGDKMSLDKALMASNRSKVQDVTYTQYFALMRQLGAVA